MCSKFVANYEQLIEFSSKNFRLDLPTFPSNFKTSYFYQYSYYSKIIKDEIVWKHVKNDI